MLLTVDQARDPAASSSGDASSCIAFPNIVSMSSEDTPFACRKTAFFSRGASRILGSSKKRDACSNRPVVFVSFFAASELAGSSATGFVLSSAAFSGLGSCSAERVGGSVVAVRCQVGIEGLDIVVCSTREGESVLERTE